MQTIKMRGVVAAVTGALLFGFGANAMADSTDDILNALIAKGVLTEEEGALLQKGRTGEKEAAEKKKKEGVSTKIKDGTVSWESGDGNTSVALTGRLHFDMHNSDVKFPSGQDYDKDTASAADQFEVRRARIGVKGKIAKDFKYEAVTNLVGGTPTIDVAYLDWAKYDQANIRFGKFKQPFNLEELTSSNNIDFMERSYVNQLAPAKKLGVMFMGEGTPGFTYAASAFQFNDTELDYKNDEMSYAGRTTLNFAEFMGQKDAIYHVGLSGFDNSYTVRSTSSSSSAGGSATSGTVLAYRGANRGLANIFRAQIQGEDTGTFQSASSDKTSSIDSKAWGLEGVIAKGPFKFQAEYVNADYKADYNDTAKMKMDTNAWYAEMMWMLTGENYADSYKKGVFGAIKPKSSYDLDTGKGWGAWELGLRAEGYDVDSGSITGGGGGTRFQGNLSCDGANGKSSTATGNSTQGAATESGCQSGAKSYTAGLKWILNPNLLFKLNYTYTKFDYKWDHFDVSGTKFLDNEQIISLRGQWMF
jgi:phosphate-selective porin OprO and OprP